MNGAAISLIALSWLWPFGADDPADEETIRHLEGETVEVDPSAPIPGSDRLARENYRRFLELADGDPLQPEALRRLADLELEATESAAADADAAAAAAGYDDAIGLYRELLATYPDYDRNDLVLYQLARACESSGRREEALAVLDELIAEWPETVHRYEAQFRRGEMLFVLRRYAAAESAYRSLAEAGPDTGFHQQALYKLGWSRFKLGRHEDSLEPFFALLDLRLPPGPADRDAMLEPLDGADRELVADTFRALSISFSYLQGAGSIDAYLDTRPTPHYAHVIYRNLGDLYLEKERYDDAADTYRAFVDRYPSHLRAPHLLMQVAGAYEAGGFPTLVLDAKEQFVDRYGMDRPWWDGREPGEHGEVVAYLKSGLTDLARHYHAEAQRGGDAGDYRQAARWYRRYLEYFPDEPGSAGTHFLLAEILFESGDFRAATDEYEATAYGYPFHDKAAEAGYAALLAYRRHETDLADDARTAWRDRYTESALRFASTFPDHPESGAVMTSIAEDLFRRGDFERAIEVAGDVVAKVPPVAASLEETAWRVIAHSEFDLGRYAPAETAYLALRARLDPDDADALAEVRRRIAASIYRQGEIARDAGDREGAVGHFLRVAEVVPAAAIRETAEYDAAAVLIEMQAWTRAGQVLEAFRAAYPDSEHRDEVTRRLAVVYLESGARGRAADEFRRIAAAPGAAPTMQREALWQAAELYRETASAAAEAETLADLVRRFPAPVPEAIEARQRLADLAGEAGDAAARRHWLEAIVTADGAAGAARTDRTRYLAATASLELAEPKRQSFAALRLTDPLDRSLAAKKAVMEELLAAYGRAADYGVAGVTTAATYRIAEVYHRFSRDLMDSERPGGLDELALEQYEILLEEQAFPFEEKAIELHEVNAARASAGVYDEWVRRSFEDLATLMPARYAKAEKTEDVVSGLY